MIRSKSHLSGLLKIKKNGLSSLISEKDLYYYKKVEVKKNKDGSPKQDNSGNIRNRVLYPSKGRLKLVQSRLKNVILSQIKLSPSVYGGVRGKCSVRNGKAHQGKKYKFITDLKDFFPSVTPRMIYKGLIFHGFSADVARIITHLTTYKGQVPQGAPTSTHITNIALSSLDQEMMDLCERHDITYTRYVDDLTFSSPKCFQPIVIEMVNIIKSHDLRLSHRKTAYAKGGAVLVTGAKVYNNGLGVSDEMKSKIANPGLYNQSQITGHKAYLERVRSM